MSESLCLKSVRELCLKDSPLRRDAMATVPKCPFNCSVHKEDECNGSYYIPSFQRGYRWTHLQVRQLVEDLMDFHNANDRQHEAWYCLQPLVVVEDGKKLEDEKKWMIVIDGQQRLTTLFLIIKYLSNVNPYQIEYETRKDCWQFLVNICKMDEEVAKKTPDYYCLYKAWGEINNCLLNYDENYKEQLCKTILDCVKVIWYQTSGNPYEEFTRLNSGKIALSNAELIKALLLKEPLRDDNKELSQLEAAQEWDMIERSLHNDDFWCFINPDSAHERFNATRIDFIFEMVLRKDQLSSKKYLCHSKKDNEADSAISLLEELDRNPYYIFGVFQEYCRTMPKGAIDIWHDIRDVFRRIRSWYEDRDLFHRIGYLMNRKVLPSEAKLGQLAGWLHEASKKRKSEFLKGLNTEIQKSITKNLSDLRYGGGSDNLLLNDVLLLFNIAIMMRQRQENSRYPFREHIRASWTLEHIHAKQERPLENTDLEYIAKRMMIVINGFDGKKLVDEINDKLLKVGVSMRIEIEKDEKGNVLWHLKDNKELHGIGNLALLGHKANASFNNSLFFEKRDTLSRWEKGERDDLKSSGFDKVEFVPVATKMVFFKHFSNEISSPSQTPHPFVMPLPFAWTETDAECYVEAIVATLTSAFGFKAEQLL